MITTPIVITTGNDGKARRIACEAYVAGFDSHAATVEQMQRYAECVERLHPTEPVPKSLVAVLLLCALVGTVIGWTGSSVDKAAGAFLGLLLGGVLGCLGALLAAAVWYVVS